MEDQKDELLSMTSRIVGAWLARNPTLAASIPELIRSVHGSLAAAGGPAAAPAAALTPAVPLRKSVQPDYIVCLEDGKKMKMLKRHLRTAYGLSPEQYREKWNLPPDYPMVAPNYSTLRSGFAKDNGLGTKSSRGRASQNG